MKYAVGIDLGTSNSALAYAAGEEVRVFEVPQLVAAETVAARTLLPSHLYLASEHEQHAGEILVGAYARDRGAQVPGRHVSSAKSWLCHPSVDRTAAILPWGAPPEVPRLSPVQASARILAHLRDAWDRAHPDALLAEQDLVVTVPASFDEGARALTLRAAADAGLPHLRLLEEPQAAFYDYLQRHPPEGSLVLVVDVGGGTTDLTLIKTDPLERVAVGDHLLLGGDNMDMALARTAEQRMERGGFADARAGAAGGGIGGRRLDASQFGVLVQACRAAKELLLSEEAPLKMSVAVPGTGSRMIGGALSAELTRDEVRTLLLDGFFPRVRATEAPVKSSRSGLAELGLPYASDPAITRHVAAFLKAHERTVGDLRVDAVLYNGGALTPSLLADRLTEVISSWGIPVKRLRNDAPDLAVARGAASYALVRRGIGVRIGGGSPRTYYVGVGDGGQAVCVVPRGAAEGEEHALARDFSLLLGKPVRFRLFAASGFRADKAGDVVEVTDELAELPPLQTVVPGEGTAIVRVKAALTEIGTLEVFCDGEQRWKLEFQLRADAIGGAGGALEEAGAVSQLPRNIDAAREQLQVVYGKKPLADASAKDLWRNLEKVLGDRAGWTLATLRDLWGVLWAGAQKRRRSPDHERMFLSLCGFLLRPGFGAPLDSWRVEQAWTLFSQGLTHHKEAAVWAAWWILWRRTAAGLGEEAHEKLFEAIAPHLKPAPKQRVANPGKKPPGLAVDEMVRLVGALELLRPSVKEEAGGWLLEKISTAGAVWALGRLGARVPVAGAAHSVVPPQTAATWLTRLLDLPLTGDVPFAIVQLARLSGDRARDIDEPLRQRAAAALERAGAPPDWSRSVREVVPLAEKDEQRVFGEALPLGLHLV